MKKRPVYVDKPVFKLADPNNPVEYRLKQGKWSQMPVEPLRMAEPMPEPEQYDVREKDQRSVSEQLESLGLGLGDALKRVRRFQEIREMLGEEDEEPFMPLPPKRGR